MRKLRLKIHGDVQGVGFRYSILQEAQKLRLMGFARNLPDGSVEVLAQGPKPVLESFLAWSHEGPPGATVERIEESWREPATAYHDFSITE